MKFLKNYKLLLVFIGLFGVLSFVLPAINALAQTPATNIQDVLDGLDSAAIDAAITKAPLPKYYLATRVGTYINYLLQGLGILFLGLAVFAGVQWMLARENDENIKKSKDLLRDAAVGFAIVLAAYLLTVFVTSSIFHAVSPLSTPAAVITP